ncbi:hypothetical protein ACFFX0_32350 [Citricoccus parietis]|uniref:Uncharacterized protein n=1 Tax=Citricoccus parietis TaxID=592307 RepID=A0ABV5GAG9_9MICC
MGAGASNSGIGELIDTSLWDLGAAGFPATSGPKHPGAYQMADAACRAAAVAVSRAGAPTPIRVAEAGPHQSP